MVRRQPNHHKFQPSSCGLQDRCKAHMHSPGPMVNQTLDKGHGRDRGVTATRSGSRSGVATTNAHGRWITHIDQQFGEEHLFRK
ncbi:hypothetical protein TanjilG_20279 [Lupinus angustifolius]|uniref:Uncharacterized protein n=1 Tax=Lupinus angustifolius TaxID=3871 RepID=A0A1J7IJQ7_LUPAN|nr:hypothetical protein TanjilG_20279 [Lupinus angustifolius]